MRIIAFLTLLIFGLSVHAQDINAAIEEFNQGNQAVQASNPTLAIEKYQAAMGIAATLGDEGQEIVAAAKKQIPTLYYQLGVQDYKDKNNDKAIAEFQNAIKFGEEYGDAETVEKSKEIIPKLYFTKGNDLFKEDKFDDALTTFKMAAELDPRYSRPFWGMALVYQKQAKFSDMDEAFRKSRELAIAEKDDAFVDRINTTGKRYLQSEATANLKAQKWNDAIKNLNLSNEYKADDADTYYYLALSYNGLKNWNQAIESAQKGIDLMADDTSDNKAKFYFEMGNAYKGAANNEKACEAYNNAKFGKFVENANYEITQVLKCK